MFLWQSITQAAVIRVKTQVISIQTEGGHIMCLPSSWFNIYETILNKSALRILHQIFTMESIE